MNPTRSASSAAGSGKPDKQSDAFLVAANGEWTGALPQEIKLDRIARVVAADGGALLLQRLGLTPQAIVGDLDSLGDRTGELFPESQIVHRPSQEMNDLEKALIYCREQGARRLQLIGITGKRLDHTLCNLSVLARYRVHFEMEIFHPHGRLYLLDRTFEGCGVPGQTISLMPLPRAGNVRTAGLKYMLMGEELELGRREGLSNVLLEKDFRISLNDGMLLLFINRPERHE